MPTPSTSRSPDPATFRVPPDAYAGETACSAPGTPAAAKTDPLLQPVARSSWQEFEAFCGMQNPPASPYPAAPEAVAGHLADRLARGNCAQSLVSALAVINRVHRYRGSVGFPREGAIAHVLDTATLHTPSAEGRAPAGRDVVIAIVNALGTTPRDLRDRALLWTAFSPLTKSELLSLQLTDVVFAPDDRSVTLLPKDTRKAHVLDSNPPCFHSPVSALREWTDYLRSDGVQSGPLFRGFRGTHHNRLQVRSSGLSVKGTAEVLERWYDLGLPEACTLDSFRLGYEAHRVDGCRNLQEASARLNAPYPHVLARRLLDAARLGLTVPPLVTRVLKAQVGDGPSRVPLLELFPVEGLGRAFLEHVAVLALALEEGTLKVTARAIGDAPELTPPSGPVATTSQRAGVTRHLEALGTTLLEQLIPDQAGVTHLPSDAGWILECGARATRVLEAVNDGRKALVVPRPPGIEGATHFAYVFERA